MERLLKIEKYRCRDCGEEFTDFKFAQTHNMVNNHWCDAIPKFPLEYENDDEFNKMEFTKVTTTDILTLITSAIVEGNDFYLKRLENNEIIFVVGKMIDDNEWIGNIINAHLELVD